MHPATQPQPPQGTQLTLEEALPQAVEHHRAGRLQAAEQLYRAILQAQPEHPDANHNLGVLAVSVGRVEAALPLFEAARRANPHIAQFWLSSADALVRCGRESELSALLEAARSAGLGEDGLGQLAQQIDSSGAQNIHHGRTSAQLEARQDEKAKPSRFSQRWQAKNATRKPNHGRASRQRKDLDTATPSTGFSHRPQAPFSAATFRRQRGTAARCSPNTPSIPMPSTCWG
ncbi:MULTISPECIES: tetratricopeptide repeat protein [Thiorhodovibrio]|uniref:tetratricopeptide repeat protein n=1 Tax=Thiorhodovibrio TaxID=61593 RepID=UPI0019148BCC|nr:MULTISPECIES: tetratricopeptide repeat protein [Thiorhodovibrio]MBK5969481.1 hypothetical protein [Thiorhodovibrio winogradskyi]WPL14983.1 putative O-linked N-acetylglucosamine transferase, SPINDLY family [Thiorhodovibrio litoralis]